MSLPRCGRSFGKLSLAVVLTLLAAAQSPLRAQDTTAGGADTTRRDTASAGAAAAPAGQAASATGQTGMRPDSLPPDSLRRDSLPRDTGSAARPPAAPVDSALAAACRESGGEPPDLLTVVFKSSATAAEREAVAREVGGSLVAESRHQAPGAWYLRAPGSGINPLIADRLILQPNVLEVGATRCPR